MLASSQIIPPLRKYNNLSISLLESNGKAIFLSVKKRAELTKTQGRTCFQITGKVLCQKLAYPSNHFFHQKIWPRQEFSHIFFTKTLNLHK